MKISKDFNLISFLVGAIKTVEHEGKKVCLIGFETRKPQKINENFTDGGEWSNELKPFEDLLNILKDKNYELLNIRENPTFRIIPTFRRIENSK